jgi:hypothetical protein
MIMARSFPFQEDRGATGALITDEYLKPCGDRPIRRHYYYYFLRQEIISGNSACSKTFIVVSHMARIFLPGIAIGFIILIAVLIFTAFNL